MIHVNRKTEEGRCVHVGFDGPELDVHDLAIALHIQTTLQESEGAPIVWNRVSLRVMAQALHEFIENKATLIEARQAVEKYKAKVRAEDATAGELPDED